jgi:hypothetical protein
VTITATYNSVQRTANLTVNPVSGGSLSAPTLVSPANDARFRRGRQVTFDWSDVPGAAGYTIQIDDSDSFSAPLTLSQTTTTSQFSSSSLPRGTLRWRVRANDSAGGSSAWSSVRRVRIE